MTTATARSTTFPRSKNFLNPPMMSLLQFTRSVPAR
jgi:hypothetical protein